MLPVNLALVSEVKGHDPGDVARVAAALQRQATRDFGPIWDVKASVNAFPSLKDVPTGYWPMIVQQDINTPGAAGVHEDKNGQPFALIAMSDSWSLTASHEMLEMLGDPFGRRTVPGKSPKRGQGRVEFLVEVCDPSESQDFSYQVNGVLVSDFYTPHFFDPHNAAGIQYSFTGAIKRPREVLKEGYLSWHNQIDDHWYQLTWFTGSKPAVRDLGTFAASNKSWREIVDGMTPTPAKSRNVRAKTGQLFAALPRLTGKTDKVMLAAGPSASSAARAGRLETQIQTLLK